MSESDKRAENRWDRPLEEGPGHTGPPAGDAFPAPALLRQGTRGPNGPLRIEREEEEK